MIPLILILFSFCFPGIQHPLSLGTKSQQASMLWESWVIYKSIFWLGSWCFLYKKWPKHYYRSRVISYYLLKWFKWRWTVFITLSFRPQLHQHVNCIPSLQHTDTQTQTQTHTIRPFPTLRYNNPTTELKTTPMIFCFAWFLASINRYRKLVSCWGMVYHNWLFSLNFRDYHHWVVSSSNCTVWSRFKVERDFKVRTTARDAYWDLWIWEVFISICIIIYSRYYNPLNHQYALSSHSIFKEANWLFSFPAYVLYWKQQLSILSEGMPSYIFLLTMNIQNKVFWVQDILYYLAFLHIIRLLQTSSSIIRGIFWVKVTVCLLLVSFASWICSLQVREIVSVLDLDVLFYPCPKKGPNFRPKVLQMGGKQQFPYMVLWRFIFLCTLEKS